MGMNSAVNAQIVKRSFYFSPGQEFIKETQIKSTGVVQRGKQILNIVTNSTVNKSFKVTDSTAAGYTLAVNIEEMDNVIKMLGDSLHYNSKKPIDNTSSIQKALKYMVDKPVELHIDLNGIILSAIDPTEVLATDTLLAFAGIQPEFFEKDKLFSLVGDFINLSGLSKGYTWSDSTVIDDQRISTDYLIYDLSEKTTIVKLTNKSVGKMLNSTSNATYVVDNASGIIFEKIIYTNSVGFRVANRLLYGVSRSSSIVERLSQRKTAAKVPILIN